MTARVCIFALGAVTLASTVGVAVAQAGVDRGERTTAPVTDGLRRVAGRVVESPGKPRAGIEVVDSAFRYLGGHRFVLYGVANAEQHVFADVDGGGRVRRLYWIQFEGYLPSAPSARYDYSASESRTSISGFSFQADGGFRGAKDAPRKGSDGALMRQLVAARKLELPAEAFWQRLVWVDEGGRDELMFIYLEDLGPQGLTAADLEPGGKAASRGAAMKRALLTRAASGIRLLRR